MSEFLPRPLTMMTKDGKLYARLPAVEQQITETLRWSEAEVLGKRKSVLNETLFYNIQRFHERDEEVYGLLLRELGQRTIRIVKASVGGLDRLAKEDIAMQVELEIMELAMAPQPTRKSEFLEIAFTQAVRRRAINLREQLENTVQGNRMRPKRDSIPDLEERTLKITPDSREEPEAAMVAFQDEQFRDQAYEIVRLALEGEDNRLLPAFRLHVVDGWPIWSPDPKVPTVARQYGLTQGQAKYMLEKTRKIIAEVLSAYSAGKKTKGAGR